MRVDVQGECQTEHSTMYDKWREKGRDGDAEDMMQGELSNSKFLRGYGNLDKSVRNAQ